jgi:flagellar M-ring protein FliF
MNLNLRQITAKLSTRGWITIGVSALVGVLFVYLLMSMASKPSYTTLVGGQSPTQTEKITTALSAAAIPYQLDNNGTSVQVQTSDVGQARDLLSTGGLLLGSGSGSSFESLLGTQSLGESNFQQEQVNTSASEQYLEQQIESMNGINSSQVDLAIPDQTDDLFSGVNTQPSASVLINTDTTLSATTVKAIADTVANGVSGLSASKVTITDQNGDLLWPSSGAGTSGLTAKQSAEQAYNSQESEEADAYLAASLGADKALVQVNADVNTNTQSVDSLTYGTKKTPLTSATSSEKLTGSGAAAAAAGNTATALGSIAGTSTVPTNYNNNTNTTTNGVDKTVSTTNIAPGGINRQSVSVMVNSSVPASEIPAIKSTVENAVGFLKKRGDTISIQTVPFPKVTPAATTSSSSPLGDLKYVLVGLGSLVFLLLISRMLRKRESENFAGSPTWLRELELPRPLSELEAQTQMVDLNSPAVVARLRSPVNMARQQVEELVDRDPERVASQLRQWMTED